MNKKQLKQELKVIQDQYEGVESIDSDLLNRSCLEPYVQCLNNPDLKAHLIETGLVEPGSNMENELKYFDNDKGIIEAFKYDLEVLADDELIISIEKKKQDELNLKYQKLITKEIIGKQSQNAAVAIDKLYGKVSFIDDVNGNDAKGLYSPDIVKMIGEQEKLLAKGDLTSLENMLHSQTHTLNAIFNKMTALMADATQIKQIEAFGRIALKAQTQTRQTISTLAELKGLKKTTFIHQVNQAHNQQVNNGAGENSNKSSNERSLLSDVDNGITTKSEREILPDKTVSLPERDENTRGISSFSSEQLQTRDAIRPDDRVAETINSIKQAGARG